MKREEESRKAEEEEEKRRKEEEKEKEGNLTGDPEFLSDLALGLPLDAP